MTENQLRIRLYDFRFNGDLIFTQYGLVSYLDWLTKEKARIEKDPSRKAEIVNTASKRGPGLASALYVNEVKDCNCFFCRLVYRKDKGI